MNVNRESLLKVLQKGSHGLTSHETLEQSNAFVFQDGKMITFDGEVLSVSNFDIGFDAAIPGTDFLKILQRFPDEEVEISLQGKELRIKGKRKQAGLTMPEKVSLPFKEVPEPGKMRTLPEELSFYLLQAARICGKDHSDARTTHVHVTPNLIESTECFRLYRAELETGLKEDILIPAAPLISLGQTKLKKGTVSNGWLHILTEDEVRLSILCSQMEYFKKDTLEGVLSIDGEEITLPKNLKEILERASIMEDRGVGSGEGEAQITIEDDKILIRTEKDGGWYQETKKISYGGEPLRFVINPNFLHDILSKTNKVLIGNMKIKIIDGNVSFIVCLGKE